MNETQTQTETQPEAIYYHEKMEKTPSLGGGDVCQLTSLPKTKTMFRTSIFEVFGDVSSDFISGRSSFGANGSVTDSGQ